MAVQPIDNVQTVKPGTMEGTKKSTLEMERETKAETASIRQSPMENNKGTKIDTKA